MNQKADGSRSHEARDRLRAAAATAFAARGFHGTTTRDIAAGADMSPAALYVHYGSKEELLNEISHEGHLQTLALIDDATAAASEPTARLEEFVRRFVAHHAHSATTARIVNYELASLSPDHLAEVLTLRRRISAGVRAIIQSGIESGEFTTTDPDLTTTAILSLGIDVARWYRPEGRWSAEDLGSFYAELALRAVGVASSPETNISAN